MSMANDCEQAAECLDHLQTMLWDLGDHSQDDDVSSLICMLQSPLFRQLLVLQDSIQELEQASGTTNLEGYEVDFKPELHLEPISGGQVNPNFEPETPTSQEPVYAVSQKQYQATAGYNQEIQRVIETAAEGRETETIKLFKPEKQSLGFSVAPTEGGIFIQDLQPGGIADRHGRLRVRDQILAIDGQPLDISHQEAIKILQSAGGLVELIVARGPYPTLSSPEGDQQPPPGLVDPALQQQQPPSPSEPTDMNSEKRSRSKRRKPEDDARDWIQKEKDPPGYEVQHFVLKGRGVVTTNKRRHGQFLLVYKGEIITAEEGDEREEIESTGFRFFYKHLCVDASKEDDTLGRLVNHGSKKMRNAAMKEIDGHLCLFAQRDIDVGEELLYDYGLKLPWEETEHPMKAKYSSLFSTSSPPSSLLLSTSKSLSSPSNSLLDTATTSSSASVAPDASKTSPSAQGLNNYSFGGGPGSRGGRGRGRGGGRRRDTGGSRNSGIHVPLPLVGATSFLSPAQLEKHASQQGERNGTLDRDLASMSSLFEHSKDSSRNNKPPSPKFNSASSSLAPTPSSPTKSCSTPNSASQDKVHIDPLKKKLIADQIRQRVQSKMAGLSPRGSRGQRRGRGLGRPPKPPGEPELSPKELEGRKKTGQSPPEPGESSAKSGESPSKSCESPNKTADTSKAAESPGKTSREEDFTPTTDVDGNLSSMNDTNDTNESDQVDQSPPEPGESSAKSGESPSKSCESPNKTADTSKAAESPGKTSREEDFTPTTDVDGNLSSMDDTNDTNESDQVDQSPPEPGESSAKSGESPSKSCESPNKTADTSKAAESPGKTSWEEDFTPTTDVDGNLSSMNDTNDTNESDVDHSNDLIHKPEVNRHPNDYVSDSESDTSDIYPFQALKPSVVVADKPFVEKADSTTDPPSKDTPQIQTVSRDRRGKHDYNKKHCCIFCGKLDLKIARHLEKKHSNEAVIASLPKTSKDKNSESQQKRERTLDALRNQGDFMFNVDVLKNIKSGVSSGELIVARRPIACQHEVDDYVPCKYCLRFFIKTDLWRHCGECKFVATPLHEHHNETRNREKNCISAGKQLLAGAGVVDRRYDDIEYRQDFHDYILDSIASDNMGREVKKDSGIVSYGKSQFEKLGKQRASGIRYRMRLLARIKMQLLQRHVVGEGPDLVTYLRPENFDHLVWAVKQVVEVCNETSLNGVLMFAKPEVAKKTGHCLKKIAEMYLGRMIMKRDLEGKQNVADFLVMYDMQWSDRVGSVAHQTANERKFNKKEILPTTEDVVKLQKFQDKLVQEKSTALSKDRSMKNWMVFGKILLSKIQTFNFRRGNESSKMQLNKYAERADWRQGNMEIYRSLGKLERSLAERMDLVEVIGKQNRKVPVLLTPSMKSGIDLLNSTREECGVNPSNVFVFAKGEDSYITGADALNYVLREVPDLKHPEQIRLPKMRKYLATVTQVMGIEDVELQEVARHMGHELSVHRRFYRLQDDVIELAKVSKLLLAVEAGVVSQFSGMSLDDIALEAIPDVHEERIYDFGATVEPLENGQNTPQATNTGIPRRALPDVHEERIYEIGAAEEPLENSHNAPQGTNAGTRRGGRAMKHNITYVDGIECDDEVGDPDFNAGDAACSDESDTDVPRKKAKLTQKKKWTIEEKEALKILVDKSTYEQKPPRKGDILMLQRRHICLQNIQWKSIKHNVWAMAQKKKRECKKLLGI